jgi:hypothetical protein
MTMETKNNIFIEHLPAWLHARNDRKARGLIIKHICFVAGVHPKSVPRSFRRIQTRDPAHGEGRGRKIYYGADVTASLKDVWIAASGPCGENLHGILPDYVRILIRDGMWKHEEETTAKLLRMSCGLMKERVTKFAHIRQGGRGLTTTKPGSIRSLIPLRSGPWNDAATGTMQIDTVAHCGHSIAGDFIYTVNAADVSTLWGARRAQWNKGKEATVCSMEAMDDGMPFPVVEWHPDSGSEFVNWHCKGWCKGRDARLTRSRPNRKNDNCFVEERNGHIVRRWVEYVRLDAREAVNALNALYDVLTPYLNHFAASRRTIVKERDGSKWKITREKKSLTPYERVLLRTDVSENVKERLRIEHERLNPLVMKKEIDRRLHRVFDVNRRYGKPTTEERLG